jgi:hypothetical protein
VQLGRVANGGSTGAQYGSAYIGGDGTTTFDYTANTNTGNASALTDASIRRTIQRLDDNDTPMDNRFFLIPPSSRNTLMGLARYTEQAFVGNGDAIRNGEIGNLYGIPVFTSSNADSASATAAFPTSGSAIARVCLMGHKDAMVLVEQVAVRSQVQYKQEYLATLFTSDTLYGVAALRSAATVGAAKSSAMFALVVPS